LLHGDKFGHTHIGFCEREAKGTNCHLTYLLTYLQIDNRWEGMLHPFLDPAVLLRLPPMEGVKV
jgi:hypothetical protein